MKKRYISARHAASMIAFNFFRNVTFALYFVLLGASLVSLAIATAAAQQEKRVPVEQSTTGQKAKFVAQLVEKSVASRTIEAQGDDAAKAALNKARSLVREAKAELKQGRYEDANAKLNEALHLVNVETRRLSGAEAKQKRLQEAYEKRRNSVQIFLAAYERVASEKKLSSAAQAQVAEIRNLLNAAELQAKDGNLGNAKIVMEQAYVAARGDIKELRQGETLTRSLNFKTPEQEYEYERNRNDSHVLLLKFAISERKPPQSRLKRIGSLREKATSARAKADQQAQSGDHATAIATITKATETLLKAIRMSGIWIPG